MKFSDILGAALVNPELSVHTDYHLFADIQAKDR
jgi:hypothetical protein